MQKIIILGIAFSSFWSATARGQIRVDVGLKGGLNVCNVKANAPVVQSYNYRSGFHFGAYTMIRYSKVALQPEVVFSRQGQVYSYPVTGYNNVQTTLDYLNIPIIVKVYLVGGFNLQAGPQFGYLLNSTGYTILGSTVTSQSLNAFVKPGDTSFVLGLGWDLPLGLNLTARYNAGVSDINEFTGTNSSQGASSSFGTQKAKNKVFQFSIGYRLFKFGK